jgi:hypothetical protein
VEQHTIPSTDGIEISHFTFPLGGTSPTDQSLAQNQVVTVSIWDFGMLEEGTEVAKQGGKEEAGEGEEGGEGGGEF